MRASQRYKIEGPWRKVGSWKGNRRTDLYEAGDRIQLERFVADISDTQGGYYYEQGAFKVIAKNLTTGKVFHRQKVFYGETAWSDSRRLYEDLVNQVQYQVQT